MGFLWFGRKTPEEKALIAEEKKLVERQKEAALYIFQAMQEAAGKNHLANCKRIGSQEIPEKGIDNITITKSNPRKGQYSVFAWMKSKKAQYDAFSVMQVEVAIFKKGQEIHLFREQSPEIRLDYSIDQLEEAKNQAVDIIKNYRLFPP